MAETTKTDLICDTLGVVPLRRQTSNMLWHANVSWTFSRNVWGNQHFFIFFLQFCTHTTNTHKIQDQICCTATRLHYRKTWRACWNMRVPLYHKHTLTALTTASPALGLFSFRVLRCVSRHISTPVYQSFYHLTTAPSPPSEGKQEVPTHTQTPMGGSVEGGGGGWWRCWPDVNDLTRYRIRLRLYRSNPPACVSLNRLVSSGQVEGQTGRLKTLWEK